MKTVLVIVDRHELRENITEILGLSGFKTLQSVTPKVGFETALANLPDVIVFDIMIEEQEVAQFFAKLSAHPTLRNTPTVILDGNVVPSRILIAVKELNVTHIAKPFPQEVLVDAVTKCSETRNGK